MVRPNLHCAIAGCGPAGAMLGLLLARAGLNVLVLEKHADFLRDFRGDTVHPSTLNLLDELDLGERMAQLPQRREDVFEFGSRLGTWRLADFSRLSGPHRYIAMMPQWDLLSLLTDAARAWPGFQLKMNAEVIGIETDGGRVTGLRYLEAGATHVAPALLSVAADGRSSAVRRAARLVPREFGTPIDVLWFRLPRRASDPTGLLARVGERAMAILIDRDSYWQIAYLVPKNSYQPTDASLLPQLREHMGRLAPFLSERTDLLTRTDDLHLLSVQLNRLSQWWRDGLLCIGDAAHAKSPVGGVGINLAVQDAVATANRLAAPLASRQLTATDLQAVQHRRHMPTVATQALQRIVHRRLLEPVFAGAEPRPPLLVRALSASRLGQSLGARAIGYGLRPEHVKTPAVSIGDVPQ